MSLKQTITSIAPGKSAILVAVLFLHLLLFFALQTPLTFDDAFNANVALSVAQGNGYGTHVGGEFVPFNPYISTGALFIAPLSVVLHVLGTSISTVAVYSLLVAFFFFSMALVYSWRLHRYAPLMIVILSAAFLADGKTDLVGGTKTPNLPAPVYGLWFQFLGNMSGIWSAMAAIILCAGVDRARFRDLVVIFACTTFACNSKVVHALPCAVMLAVLCISLPRVMWPAFLVGLLGICAGVRADAWFAKAALDAESFDRYRASAREFFIMNQGFYVGFLRSPSWQGVTSIVENIVNNWWSAVRYVGRPLVLAAFVTMCVCLASYRAATRPMRRGLLRLVFALLCASVGVILWWSGLPGAPTRFLTSVAPLLTVATASALCVALCSAPRVRRGVSIVVVAACVAVASYRIVHRAPKALAFGRAVRTEQIKVAQIAKEARELDSTKLVCGMGWWYPHEISFLSGSPSTIPCGANFGALSVLPKHIVPREVIPIIRPSSCRKDFSGKFYNLAVCGPLEATG